MQEWQRTRIPGPGTIDATDRTTTHAGVVVNGN